MLSITVPYLAEYQLVNSSLAVGAIHMIDPQHVIRDEVIAEGIRSTRWQGRMETVLPGVVLDGAHNADGIKEFYPHGCWRAGAPECITAVFRGSGKEVREDDRRDL